MPGAVAAAAQLAGGPGDYREIRLVPRRSSAPSKPPQPSVRKASVASRPSLRVDAAGVGVGVFKSGSFLIHGDNPCLCWTTARQPGGISSVGNPQAALQTTRPSATPRGPVIVRALATQQLATAGVATGCRESD